MISKLLSTLLSVVLVLNLTTGVRAERREFSGCTNSDTLVTTEYVRSGTIVPAGSGIGFKVDCEDDTSFGGGSVALFTIAGIIGGAALGVGVYYFLQTQNSKSGLTNSAEQFFTGASEKFGFNPIFNPNTNMTGLNFVIRY